MYSTTSCVISKNSILHKRAAKDCRLANNLYNASLFRVRQIFTGWDKEKRTNHETEVFNEVKLLEETYHIQVKHVVSYQHLEKLLRVTNNPDFFAGLPMQTAQNVVRQAVDDFKNWLKALKDYRTHPEKYLGKPKMPHYKKSSGYKTCPYTNQDMCLYPSPMGGSDLKFPGMKERMHLSHISPESRLKEVKIRPYYGRYLLILTLETAGTVRNEERPNMAAIDFGVDNFAAFVCTDLTSRLYKGGAILSKNMLFHKERAKAISILTKGHKPWQHKETKHLYYLSRKHDSFEKDQLHKISRSIINLCNEHHVGTLVLGVNKGWKQHTNMGRKKNQQFVSTPVAKLREAIRYKAEAEGIVIIEQEESYTSKADITQKDPIPVYGDDVDKTPFSGRRITRGLYRCKNGQIINADCNGAANILRKAYPDAWRENDDFSFLARPEVYGFHELNPKSIPVKRIEAA